VMRRDSGDLPPATKAHGGAWMNGAAWPPWPSLGLQAARANGMDYGRFDECVSIYGV
jgi:hypothetical protein